MAFTRDTHGHSPPHLHYPSGGFIALAPGTGSGQARKAKSSRGAPAPVITNNGKTVTWTISSLARTFVC